MKIKVNPNRMMLLRLRRRLELAERGHKLLKNKQEKLMQNFFALVKETVELRKEVEKRFIEIGFHYLEARGLMDRQALDDVLRVSAKKGKLNVDFRHEMNVKLPVFSFEIPEGDLSYSLPSSPVQIDSTLAKLYEAFPDLVRLAEKENLLFHLSEELEKTRRRVNALEYVLIPDLGEVIRSIENKLSENERSNQTRLMKIKDMVKERAV
ncbi:MAG: hypothetical protein B6D63_01175 [Candidatus Latescibacteria bacterium 4484_7]|nr:MAG: hypothetical protein B6D63_01175 [Candidatus Latescibacteria bacterium 4484_7]